MARQGSQRTSLCPVFAGCRCASRAVEDSARLTGLGSGATTVPLIVRNRVPWAHYKLQCRLLGIGPSRPLILGCGATTGTFYLPPRYSSSYQQLGREGQNGNKVAASCCSIKKYTNFVQVNPSQPQSSKKDVYEKEVQGFTVSM